MNIIEQGIAKGLIRFDEDKKYITYGYFGLNSATHFGLSVPF